MSLHETRLKHDFKYYCETKLHIPFREDKYLITTPHNKSIQIIQDNDFTIFEAYRWFWKTDLVSFCWAIWRAEMWNESAVILSANEDLAFQKLDLIRCSCEFDNNNLSYMCWKWVDWIIWNRWEIWLLDKNKSINIDWRVQYKIKAKIYAKWLFSNYRWIHVHNIIWDDIVVESNSNTPDMREQTKKTFLAAAMWMRLSIWKTHVVVVWTPQHPEDLLWDLMNPDNRAFAKIRIPAYDKYWLPSCPELHSLEWLKQQESIVKWAIWKQEYMLEAVVLDKDFFWSDIIDRNKNHSLLMQFDYQPNINEVVFIWVDFSIIEDKRHAEQKDTDYFAICAMVYNKITHKRRILNLYRERWVSKWKQLWYVILWSDKYNATYICLEVPWFLSWAKSDVSDQTTKKLLDTTSWQWKFDISTWIPSLQFEFEKWMIELPYWDLYSQTQVKIFETELKFLWQTHDDVADCVLRCERWISQILWHSIKYDKNMNIYWNNTATSRSSSFFRLYS